MLSGKASPGLRTAYLALPDEGARTRLVTALRTPLLGCGDDDLYTFRVTYGGRWDHQAELPAGLPPDHPVAEAIVALRRWHDMRLWASPSELLGHVIRDRRRRFSDPASAERIHPNRQDNDRTDDYLLGEGINR